MPLIPNKVHVAVDTRTGKMVLAAMSPLVLHEHLLAIHNEELLLGRAKTLAQAGYAVIQVPLLEAEVDELR